jgi:hypothetical protein
MLGTPNHGSFDIPRVIAGNERIVKFLARVDIRLSASRLRDILNTFVGTYQMLPSPFTEPQAEPLYQAQSYAPVQVSQRHLNTAREHHDRLRAVVDPDRMVYVAGSGMPTYVELTDPTTPLNDAKYRLSLDGDGRVSHALGLLSGDTGTVPTYYAPTSLGGLTRHRDVLDALTDLLTTGQASQLAERPTAVRVGRSQADLLKQKRAEDEQAEKELLALARQLRTRARTRGSLSRAVVRSRSRKRTTDHQSPSLSDAFEELIVSGWPAPMTPPVGPCQLVARQQDPSTIRVALRLGDIGEAHQAAGEEDGNP